MNLINMKLTFFKTEYSFNKWFRNKRDDFYFTYMNLRCVEDPCYICRLTDKNKTIGIVVYTQFYKDEIYINLFEIQEKYRKKGYGKIMYQMLIERLKPKFVLLDSCDDDSRKFWKSLGFHRRIKYAINENEMYKKYNN